MAAGRELIAHVEDLEPLRQAGELPVRAQEPVAQAVEGADPHAAHGNRELLHARVQARDRTSLVSPSQLVASFADGPNLL